MIQEMPVWASQLYLDVETEIYQRRYMPPEEFLNGLLKEQRLSTPAFNSLMYLLTTHSNPSPFSMTLWDLSLPIPNTAVEANGDLPDPTTMPELTEVFPTGLPNPPKPAGFTYLLRKI